MNKPKDILFAIIAVLLFSILLSPFISLILSDQLRDHAYRRLAYNVIADKEIYNAKNTEEKVQKLFRYVVRHEFSQGVPYKCKPLESLIFGEAYCDFQARTLNSLLSIAGVKSRYAMLLDENGVSPHTLNEVFLDGKWCVFDPSMNIIFKDQAGKMLSLGQLTNDPARIYNNHKLMLIKDYDKARYENISTWYSAMFPLRGQPRRSTPGIYKTHIFDWFMDAYFKIFKKNFSDFYQGVYLQIKSKQFSDQDLKLFYLARNYHLFNRSDKALLYYNELLRNFPESAYKKDTLFFMGILYFDIFKDYNKAIYFFKLTVDIYPDKWVGPANYYLGLAYGHIEDKKESLSAYRNTDITKVKREVLRELIKYKTEELSIGGLRFREGGGI